MKSTLLLLSLILVAAALAGCHDPADKEGTTPGADDAEQVVTLTARETPGTVQANESFTITVDVDAERATTSVHSGFHWSYNTTAGRTGLKPSDLDGASPHVTTETAFPGSYTIPPWTFAEPGTYYARPHTQADGQDWWGDEFTIVVE